MKRCKAGGCPYTASWLIHINLYRKCSWYIFSTKMEEASFKPFTIASYKYQLESPTAYYVHHMSEYEHGLHNKFGIEVARNKTSLLTYAAYNGECSNFHANYSSEYISLIPFYGGFPPNVTAEFKVKSIGQGNSLMDIKIKALQCMATVCSCLRYFGRVVIGVSREEDKEIITQMIAELPENISGSIHIVHIQMDRPAHLPFHLLTWGQAFIKSTNCALANIFTESKYSELYRICKGNIKHIEHIEVISEILPKFNISTPIKFIYYTESDQIVRFDNITTLSALSDASNSTTFFVGRRKSKNILSEPDVYMDNLDSWRECCAAGSLLDYPVSNEVHLIEEGKYFEYIFESPNSKKKFTTDTVSKGMIGIGRHQKKNTSILVY